MEEHQVTIANETLALPSPFFVIATQNPLEHEGTYPLPEAELDRFFMKIVLTYPKPEDEKRIFMTHEKKSEKKSKSKSSLTEEELIEMQDYIKEHIHIEPKIYDYISDILQMTREKNHPHIAYGASTRAGLALIDGARIAALLDDRDYVMPDDIKYIAHDILHHRIGLSYSAISERMTTDILISEILDTVRIP